MCMYPPPHRAPSPHMTPPPHMTRSDDTLPYVHHGVFITGRGELTRSLPPR
jgi:hypothetical protein